MKFDFLGVPSPSATDPEGNITKTSVIIRCDEHYTILSANLDGDWSKRDKADVVNAVLEYNHKLLFVDRAMAESVLKVEELDKVISEAKSDMNKLKEELQSVIYESRISQATVLEIITQLTMSGVLTIPEEEEGLNYAE